MKSRAVPAALLFTILVTGCSSTGATTTSTTIPVPESVDWSLDSPLAYWRFNEVEGTVAEPSVGDVAGVYSGGVTLNRPGVGLDSSVELDGVDDLIEFEPSDAIDALTRLTWEAWIWPADLTGIQIVATRERGNAIRLSGSRLIGSLRIGGSTVDVTGTSRLQPETWYHVALSFDGTVVTLYLGGIEEASVAATGVLEFGTGAHRVGNLRPDDERAFAGRVDEYAIYDIAVAQPTLFAHAVASPDTGEEYPIQALIDGLDGYVSEMLDPEVQTWCIDNVERVEAFARNNSVDLTGSPELWDQDTFELFAFACLQVHREAN